MAVIDKPALKLVGEDGNAFAILGRAKHAAQKAGWDKDRIKALMDDATSGNYDHLLCVMMDNFDTDNEDEDEYWDDED